MELLTEKARKSRDSDMQTSACETQSFRWARSVRSWIIHVNDGLSEYTDEHTDLEQESCLPHRPPFAFCHHPAQPKLT